MLFWKKDKKSILRSELRQAIKKCLGYGFSKKELLHQALTHSSARDEGDEPKTPPNMPHINERLEFLGDAVLGLVISEILYAKFPMMHEGKMSVIKSNLVSRESLAQKCRAIGLDKLIIVGKGIRGSALPVSVLANAMEAVFGAIFLESGYKEAGKVITKLFADDIETGEEAALHSNYKAILQDYSQRRFARVPSYRVTRQFGPKHKPTFEVMVYLPGKSPAGSPLRPRGSEASAGRGEQGDGGQSFGPGVGHDKKSAEQLAAKMALEQLGIIH
ncbi:MAG: ribonuclease III [Planctomycetota bacterium]